MKRLWTAALSLGLVTSLWGCAGSRAISNPSSPHGAESKNFSSAAKKKASSGDAEAGDHPARGPSAAPSWVCEVEANAKIFTGIGASEQEALLSARSTCGSHFQSSACTQADCHTTL